MSKISKDKKYYLLDEDNDLFEVTAHVVAGFPAWFEDKNRRYEDIEESGDEVYKDGCDNIFFSEDTLHDIYRSINDIFRPIDLEAPLLDAFPSTKDDFNVLKSHGDEYSITPIPIGDGSVVLRNLRKDQSVVCGDGKRYIYILTKKEVSNG